MRCPYCASDSTIHPSSPENDWKCRECNRSFGPRMDEENRLRKLTACRFTGLQSIPQLLWFCPGIDLKDPDSTIIELVLPDKKTLVKAGDFVLLNTDEKTYSVCTPPPLFSEPALVWSNYHEYRSVSGLCIVRKLIVSRGDSFYLIEEEQRLGSAFVIVSEREFTEARTNTAIDDVPIETLIEWTRD